MPISDILGRAYSAWNACAGLRSRRARCKRFTYGDQWSDPVADGRNGTLTEAELIERSGTHAYTNNLIRQLVKTVVGRYRTNAADAAVYAGDIAAVARANSLAELDARLLEEFLISGCAIQRIVDERRWNGSGVWIDNVDPRRFFVNAFCDPRGWDIDLCGMLHDMSLPEIINRFAGSSAARAAELRKLFGTADAAADSGLTGMESTTGSFFCSGAAGKYRVVEVWSFDSRPGSDSSPDADFCWHCRFFAPDGTLLADYDSPYGHGSHPFAVKFYPLTDGEVHSFVEDVLDQQKFINRLVVTLDHIMACSAKGVLLFPTDQLPKNVSWDHVADAWARADGVIPVTGRGTAMPQQVVTTAAGNNAFELLGLQMKLFEQVSGVGSALMGRASGARGADMLDNEVRNATIALADLFDSFTAFTDQRNAKALAVARV